MQWFRSYHGAPTDPLWIAVGKRAGVAPGVVASVWWALMDHASQQGDRGDIEGFDVETIAAFFGYEQADVEAVIVALRDKGRIEGNTLKNWEKRQPKSDNSAERVRRYRAKQARDVTERNGDVTPCNALDKSRIDTDNPPVVPPASLGERNTPKAKRGTRIPEGFPDPEAREWAEAQGWDPPAVEAEAEIFRDHWLAQPGQKGVKVNWFSTWKNWIRRDLDGRGGNAKRQPSKHNSQLETSRKAMAQAFCEDG